MLRLREVRFAPLAKPSQVTAPTKRGKYGRSLRPAVTTLGSLRAYGNSHALATSLDLAFIIASWRIGSQPTNFLPVQIMKNIATKRKLPRAEIDALIAILKARFEQNMGRHQKLVWSEVQARLESQPDKLWSL